MSIVSVQEQFQPSRYLVITNRTEDQTITTTRVIVSDLRTNTVNLVTIEKGPQGDIGPVGPSGAPGKDGLVFTVLPISSGGTNNTTFNSGYLVSYDGNKLASTNYTINDIIQSNQNNTAITGIIVGTGLQKTTGDNNTVLLDVRIGEGLTISNEQIIVDSTIARTAELSLGTIAGTVPISKGGTNNSTYSVNRLIYYDGTKFSTFPLNTGLIVVSGSKVNIVAGSGLIGGGDLTIPSGSIVLNIAASADILVEDNLISLSNTGTAGQYTKIITDSKGRVISGSALTTSDIISLLGYTPWHPGNDGAGSNLDADLLDGQHGHFYRDATNITGVLDSSKLSNLHEEPKYATKVLINTKGLIEGAFSINSSDIIDGLGYVPLNATQDAVKQGSLSIHGNLTTTNGNVSFYDNMPLFGTNREDILPSEPRGFIFNYGGICCDKTGLLAYYPGDNQLKLITNIHGGGFGLNGACDAVNPEDCYDDDANGGSAQSIFVVQNIQGEAVTVLFREIADQLYIKTTTDQTIYGLKTFLNEIAVAKQIRILSDGNPFTTPPLDLGGNNVKIPNLNADLLDDRDGSYYRNASNITGSFNYNNVSFDHIQGENNFIPKFDDMANPSRRITSSNIKQRPDGSIEVSNARNLIVGEADNSVDSASINSIVAGENNVLNSENSISVGTNNRTIGLNSVTLGSNNITSGNNSVAMNIGSIARTNNSIAAGSHGLTSVPNQFAFGAFRTSQGSIVLEHGQYSTIAAYLQGTETNGGWTSLTPIINLPTEKTVSYNIDLLINKGLSTGVASFSFVSGIITNATFRNPFNITELINSTTIPNSGTKKENFNNSQFRRHYHFWNYQPYENDQNTIIRTVQYIHSNNYLASNPYTVRNNQLYYFFEPEKIALTGTFTKTFDGSLVLDTNRPRYYSTFLQNSSSPNFKIESKNHNTINNALVDIIFESGSRYLPPSGRYPVLSSNDSNFFYVQSHKWPATKITISGITRLKIDNPIVYDQNMSFMTSGYISSDTIITNIGNQLNNKGYNIFQVLKPNQSIKLIYQSGLYNRVVRSVGSNFFEINHPIYTTGISPYAVSNDSVEIVLDEYSYFLFKECDKIYVNNIDVNISGGRTKTTATFFPSETTPYYNIVNDGGAGTINTPISASVIGYQNSGIIIENDIFNILSFSIIPANTLSNIEEGATVYIQPIFNSNSGYINLYLKDNFNCEYTSTSSMLNRHSGVYVREKNPITQQHKISLYDSGNNPITFISNPAHYSFADGFNSEYNQFFDIRQNSSGYFLYSKASFDFEENNIIPVKLTAHPYLSTTTDSFTKTVYVYIKNISENPYVKNDIPNTGIAAGTNWIYTVPLDIFEDSDNHTLSLTAEIKGNHSLPRWLSFNSHTSTFSGTPDICDVGAYSIDIKATDPSGLSIIENFIIHVSDGTVQSLEGYAYSVDNILSMSDIYLTNNILLENQPAGTLIGQIKHIGGYNPYIEFLDAENRFSGIFIEDSNLVRKCKPNIKNYPGFSISGSPEYLNESSVIYSDPSGFIPNTKVLNTYKPTTFIGTPLFTSKIIVNPETINTDKVFFNKQILPSYGLNENLQFSMRVKDHTDYSITLGDYLIQEIGGEAIILTEKNEGLLHDSSVFAVNYFIDDEITEDNLTEENGISRLKYKDENDFNYNIVWSNKEDYSFLYDENLLTSLIEEEENNNLISNQYSDIEYIPTFVPPILELELLTENLDKLLDETLSDKIIGTDFDNTIFSVSKSRIQRVFHSGVPILATGSYPQNELKSFSFDATYLKLLLSNIDYTRESNNLYYPYDRWHFLETIDNPILYVKNLGSDDDAHIISDDRSYSGLYHSVFPFEYALLETEDGFGIISDNIRHHGSRIEISDRYEILESHNVYKDNGKVITESSSDVYEILCENNEAIVHDHAISCQNGSAYLVFPGTLSDVVFSYPKIRSYSSGRINNGSHGFYEDKLENTPVSLAFSEPNFYYTWGRMIPYKFYTDEYAVKVTNNFILPSTGGFLVYAGDKPDSGTYYPNYLLSKQYVRYSGDCPEPSTYESIYGFNILENYNPLGEYVTGNIVFYTNFTSNTITINSLNGALNLDNRDDRFIYLHSPQSNTINAQLPRVGSYNETTIIDADTFTTENYFLYPSPFAIDHTGTLKLNLDRNHRQLIKNPKLLNRISIKFNSILNSNQNRLPKNNWFDILSISGNRIVVADNLNYLLNSNNYPTYLDDSIKANYLTNGFEFKGSLIHNEPNIYDARFNLSSINYVYKNLTFEFDKSLQKLDINIPENIVNVFDRIKLSDFSPLFPYMPWNNQPYSTGFTVLPENISSRILDTTPGADFILLERSYTQLQPENILRLSFRTNIFAASVSGTCTMTNKINDRLQSGILINHINNTYNSSGHRILDIIDGYSFSGFIPKLHNIISSNQVVFDNRIGYSSVVNTGSIPLLSGIRTLRQASSSDIGYTELYQINQSPVSIRGIGASHLPYIFDITGNNASRELQFLYLGFNNNNLYITGTITSPSSNDFRITKINRLQQEHIDFLQSIGVNSGVSPIFMTGSAGGTGSFSLGIPIERFDIIRFNISGGSPAKYNIRTYAQDTANPLPLIMSNSTIVNTTKTYYPSYKDTTTNLFHILPTIITTNKYCNTDNIYNPNANIFYNGNLIKFTNLSSIKSFLNFNDHLKILKFNDTILPESNTFCGIVQKINSSTDVLAITGISICGDQSIPISNYIYAEPRFRELSLRHVTPFGFGAANTFLNSTGTAEFIGHNSGTFTALTHNNIYVQAHGGSTSYWPQDPDGKIVPPSITGLFFTAIHRNTCSSGKLCITISGYKNQNIADLLEFNKSYYFDLTDGIPQLNGMYKINDKLSSDVITISTPYVPNVDSKSGIIYITDAKFNIKSKLNPNINNTFTLENTAFNLSPPLLKEQINHYDINSKKWTSIYHLIDTLPSYGAYPLRFNQTNATLIYNNPLPIEITNVSVYNSTTDTFSPINQSINIYDNTSSLILKVNTKNGTPILESQNINTPKLYISGVGSFRNIKNDPKFGYTPGSGWSVGVEIIPFVGLGTHTGVISLRDETGQANYSFSITVKPNISITPTYPTGFTTVSHPSWELYFDVYGINLIDNNPNDQGLYLVNSPNDLNYDFIRHGSSKLSVVGYPAGSSFSAGTYTPIVKIADQFSGNIIASGSGVLNILPSLNDRPPYVPRTNNLLNHYYIDITKNEKISMQVPVYHVDASHNTILTTLNGGSYFSTIRTAATHDPDMNRFVLEFTPTNTGTSSYISGTAYAPSRPFSFQVSQPVYNNDIESWQSYTSEIFNIDYTFYRPLALNTTYYNGIPSFKLNQPWSLEFIVSEGVTKHRPDLPPRVTLYNTPNPGGYIFRYASYTMSYTYDSTNKYWIARAQGKSDQYGNYAPNTGIYNIIIFADDTVKTYATGNMNIQYTNYNSIDQILPNIFTTPNNEFFINADIKQPYSDNTDPVINFDGENSINIDPTLTSKKYNPYLNIWEIVATGNKLIDKWDARLIIDSSSNPSLTIQCKGIATDKITAIAKIDLLELQNNNRDLVFGLPIKITGIGGGSKPWTPISGILVEQGDKPWKLTFSTKFGLESPLHPPTIILSGMPTFCTGYDPRLDPLYSLDNPVDNNQNTCASSPTWDEAAKAWNFAFTGIPSCTIIGPQDFSIFAIDTDLSLVDPYIEPADILNTLFTYTPIDIVYPKPRIVALSENEEPLTNEEISPFCGSPYYKKFRFGPAGSVLCGLPTGLTGIFVSGSLPPGLTYNISYPPYIEGNTFNSPIYNNFSSGTLLIQGNVTGFAPIGTNTYSEIFYLTIVDARNNSRTQEVTFAQTLDPNEPDIGVKLYFDKHYPVFTPSTGLDIIEGNNFTWRPEPEAYSFNCNNIMPDNKCPAITVFYSGLPDPDRFLTLWKQDRSGPLIPIPAPNVLYIKINQDNNNINNGRYSILRTTSTTPNINLPANIPYIVTKTDFSPRTGLATVVLGELKQLDFATYGEFFAGNISQNNICLMGNGLVDINRHSPSPPGGSTRYGIRGFIGPDFSGFIAANEAFERTDFLSTGLNYVSLPTKISNNYTIPYIDCLQTGYIRLSGILLPKIYIEITDPPPAQNRSFGDNSSTFALNPRLSYGDTVVERSNSKNWRTSTAQYTLKNLVTNSTTISASIPVALQNQPSIVLNASDLSIFANGSGAVFQLSIDSYDPTTLFPTYNALALPSAIGNIYSWSHKSANTYDIPTHVVMPPIVTTTLKDIYIVSGVVINYNNNLSAYGINMQAVGGYLPHNICPNNNCPAGYTNEPYYLDSNQQQWFATNYLPKISGMILANIKNRKFDNISIIPENMQLIGGYSNTSKQIIVTNTYLPQYNNYEYPYTMHEILDSGNIVEVTVEKTTLNGSIYTYTLLESFTTGLLSSNFTTYSDIVNSNNFSESAFQFVGETKPLIFNGKNYNIQSSLLRVFVKPVARIENMDLNSNSITIRHNNISGVINANVVMDKIVTNDANRLSTSMNAIKDTNRTLTISSLSPTGLTLVAAGGSTPSGIYHGFVVNDKIRLSNIIEDNIKILSNNISSDTEGVYDFIISGRANILYGLYTYRITTLENNAMPIFNPTYNLNFIPKAFYNDVKMYVSKPVKIVSHILNWTGSSWTLDLVVSGGKLPYLSERLEVMIDLDQTNEYTYCGFDRYRNLLLDSYDPITDTTTLKLSSNNRYNWSAESSFRIKVFDSTGYDTLIIEKP